MNCNADRNSASRRRARRAQRWSLLLLLLLAAGCDRPAGESSAKLTAIWGRRGLTDGRLQKPRAMAIDADDRIYIVDMTARIQVFDAAGQFLRRWSTPEHVTGKPTGLSIGHDGTVLVADTHYYRVLVYSPQGELLRTIGGTKGNGPGEFGLVTDVVQDSQRNYYVSEYGEYDRIQKFTPDWQFVRQWGGHGPEPGQFIRPQNMALDAQDRIWVADACNHRIQVFDTEGKLLTHWGAEGSRPGELYYPYDIDLGPDGSVYIVEFGNHRVQKFTADGQSLGCWGREGRGPGELFNPWALVRDRKGRLHVLDTNNHRVQVIEL
jgi:DNA-binding beta-propeller fold protein YncE